MKSMDRRRFITAATATAAASTLELENLAKAAQPEQGGTVVFLATWSFGRPAVDHAAQVFHSGGSLLDAVEKGINVPENDPKVESVGYGGLPNAEGEVELDAAIMDGTRHRVGAALNLHRIKNPISVARLVIEKTTHSTLAGEGAYRFAREMGFTAIHYTSLDSTRAQLRKLNLTVR